MTEYKVRFDGPLGTKFRIIGNGPKAGDPGELFFLFAALAKKFWVEYEKASPEDAKQMLASLAAGQKPSTVSSEGTAQAPEQVQAPATTPAGS